MKKITILLLAVLILLPIGIKVNASDLTVNVGTGMITRDHQKMMTSVGITVDMSTELHDYGFYSVTYLHTDQQGESSRAVRVYRDFKFMPVDYNMFLGLGVGLWAFVDDSAVYGGVGGLVGTFICDRVAISGDIDLVFSEDLWFAYTAKLSYGL